MARRRRRHRIISNVTNNLDFPEGEVIRTVTIPMLDDGVITTNLTVNLAVNPSAPAAFGDQPTATLTIINDDSAINFSAPTYTVAKNAVNGAATINIRPRGQRERDFHGVLQHHHQWHGHRRARIIIPPTCLVTFNPGVSNVAVTVPIINNGIAEGNRTVGLQLTNADRLVPVQSVQCGAHHH